MRYASDRLQINQQLVVLRGMPKKDSCKIVFLLQMIVKHPLLP